MDRGRSGPPLHPHLHLEPLGGMAGDMFLGALLDLGVPGAVIVDAVAALGLAGVGVETRPARRLGVAGRRFRVLLDGRPLEGPDPSETTAAAEERSVGGALVAEPSELAGASWDLAGIRDLLRASGLRPPVRDRAESLFVRVAGALAEGQGVDPEAVRFTGPAGVDFLVDLVGAAAAVDHLAPSRITCGPVNVGGGASRGSLALLGWAPFERVGEGERLTPTGAAILAELVEEFVEPPPLVPERIGHGLGRAETADRPNLVRVLAGRSRSPAGTNPRPASVFVAGGAN